MTMVERRWTDYAIEGALLGAFMVSASAFTALFEHPLSPLRLDGDPMLRRLLVGLAMGVTAIALIYSPWGMRSGAHMNPAVTLAFARLGKIGPADAAGYIGGQLAGGVAGMAVAALLLGPVIADPSVQWVATRPGAYGAAGAFAAELAMTLLMMTVVLRMSNHPRLAPRTGLAAGLLLAAFITFEAPLSGMSLNPARTLGSAVFAGGLDSLWIYVVAPVAGMAWAAEWYDRQGRRCHSCGHHPPSRASRHSFFPKGLFA